MEKHVGLETLFQATLLLRVSTEDIKKKFSRTDRKFDDIWREFQRKMIILNKTGSWKQ